MVMLSKVIKNLIPTTPAPLIDAADDGGARGESARGESARDDGARNDGVVERRTALDIELFAQGTRALAQARETRPRNTNRAYELKQKEWREFYAKKDFEDGELVFENKVIWFQIGRSHV